MNEEDKKQLESLRERSLEAARILQFHGHGTLANGLLLNVGYATGLAYKLADEIKALDDYIESNLV